ncbi:MAG: hypothetical protein ACK5ME_08290, partial [Parahaliea sp.]
MQVMHFGPGVRQAAVVYAGLPDGVGAPQALISRHRIEAVGFGEGTIIISLAQQALFTVDEVGAGGVGCATFSDVFGNSSAEGVVLVVRLQVGGALSGG